MNITLVALVVGCIVGLFVGSRMVRTPQPQITVVQVEPDTTYRNGCFPVVAAIVIIIIAGIVVNAVGR